MIDSRVVCIVGKGAWGSALAYIFAKAGLKVNLISASGSKNNNLTLPPSNENIITQFSNRKAELEAALSKSSLVFLAPSSKYLKKVSYEIAPYVTKQPVISLTKGIDPLTGQTMSEILEKFLKRLEFFPEDHTLKRLYEDCLLTSLSQ